jgi:hypothetical protein
MTGRRGRRRKQVMDDLKEMRRYCELKEEALDGTRWRACFYGVCGSVVISPRDDGTVRAPVMRVRIARGKPETVRTVTWTKREEPDGLKLLSRREVISRAS